MSNIRLFFNESLYINLKSKLDKTQSHYIHKVMRIKEGQSFSLFNKSGEFEVKVDSLSRAVSFLINTIDPVFKDPKVVTDLTALSLSVTMLIMNPLVHRVL